MHLQYFLINVSNKALYKLFTHIIPSYADSMSYILTSLQWKKIRCKKLIFSNAAYLLCFKVWLKCNRYLSLFLRVILSSWLNPQLTIIWQVAEKSIWNTSVTNNRILGHLGLWLRAVSMGNLHIWRDNEWNAVKLLNQVLITLHWPQLPYGQSRCTLCERSSTA